MNIPIKSRYVNEMVEIRFGKYGDGSTSIQGFSLNGEPIFKATVALPVMPAKGCVFLKDWSENEGIPEALVKAGIVEMTGEMAMSGYCVAQEAKILVDSDDR